MRYHILILHVLALVTVARPPLVAAPFELVAIHADAAAQPTAEGRTLATLRAFNGKLYAGFGNYGEDGDDGPIGIRAYDPAAGAFTERLLYAESEAVYNFREIGGRLYAPLIDPWPSPPPAFPQRESAGYALGTVNGAGENWANVRPVIGGHMYDIATLNGQDLWLVGAARRGDVEENSSDPNGTYGIVWRSEDGGATWSESLRIAPQRSGFRFARIYAVFSYGGKLYVQGHDASASGGGGPHSASKVWDGVRWSDGPALGGGYIGAMWHPEPFAGELVYDRNEGLGTGRLSKFNGTRTALAYPDSATTFYDYTIAGDTLYALLVDGRIMRTADLATWTLLDSAPSGGRSLGVLNGALYVGSADGQLYRYDVPVSESVPRGDANFDGRIGLTDYLAIDRGRAMRLTGWANGDFDRSGGVADADDYTLIDRSFLTEAAGQRGGLNRSARIRDR